MRFTPGWAIITGSDSSFHRDLGSRRCTIRYDPNTDGPEGDDDHRRRGDHAGGGRSVGSGCRAAGLHPVERCGGNSASTGKSDRSIINLASECKARAGNRPGTLGGDPPRPAASIAFQMGDSSGPVLKGVDLCIRRGEFHRHRRAIRLGQEHAACTSWARLDEPDGGSIEYDGQDFVKFSATRAQQASQYTIRVRFSVLSSPAGTECAGEYAAGTDDRKFLAELSIQAKGNDRAGERRCSIRLGWATV